MEITFEADSVSVDSDYRNSSVNVTVEDKIHEYLSHGAPDGDSPV
jgi:hypothetical protein